MIQPSYFRYRLHLCTLILVSALVSASIQAQNSPLATLPTSSAPADNAPAEPEIDAPEEIVGLLELVDMSAPQVLSLLEKMTDKIILRPQNLPVTKITFDSRGPLSKREAVLALESLLTLNGVMLTDMGGRFMKAVPAQNVNQHVPQLIADSTLNREPSQQIYAKLFKFDYLNAETGAAPLVNSLISATSSVISFPKSNALLVTDALINLQRIETVINEADRPHAIRETIKFVKLNFVQAADMQNRIESLIQGPLNSYLEGNTSVTADERSNQLILITHPGNVDTIMQVIESVDVDAAPLTASEVFQLRQAKAEEVVPIIQEIISGQKEGREEDAKVARENERNNNRPNNQGSEGGNNQPTPPTANTPAAAVIAETSSSLQFSNFVGLSADERTNAIVAYGTQQDLKTLGELIEKIDIPLPQVRIEVIITEVALTENQASGLSSFNAVFNDGPLPDDAILGDTTGALAFGLSGFGVDNSQFGNFALNAVLDIAESDTDIKILSTPTIVVNHNEEGVINVSESRPFQTSRIQDGTTNSFIRDQIEYRDVGIQLTVTPLIGIDGSVTMTIEQTVDTVRNEGGSEQGEVSTRPIIGKREANSTITVKDSEVIILGGLQSNTRDSTTTYFPIIGRLPVVRKVLSGTEIQFVRTELIIFVKPTVLRTPDQANKMSLEKIDSITGGDAVTEFLDTGTTGSIYMEDSHFDRESKKGSELDYEAKEDSEAKNPLRSKPRNLRR